MDLITEFRASMKQYFLNMLCTKLYGPSNFLSQSSNQDNAIHDETEELTSVKAMHDIYLIQGNENLG